jgi:hypothetical protein
MRPPPCECCDHQLKGPPAGDTSPPKRSRRGGRGGLLRRGIGLVEWIVPVTMLALMPKCPMCVIGYVAIATGVGISFSTATYLRIGLIAVCIASLMYLVWRKVRSVMASVRRV